jgi:hypothetical protein
MSNVVRRKFFSVDVKHSFYKSEFTSDLGIAPTRETIEKLANFKLLFKESPTGFQLLYRAVASNNNASFHVIDNAVFSFALTLNNKIPFLNFTDLTDPSSVVYASGKILYFRNTTTTTNGIVYELLNRLLPATFTYDLAVTALITDIVRLQVKDAIGTTVFTSDPLIQDDNGKYHSPVDLHQYAPGKFSIIELKNATPQTTEKVYVDSNLVGKDVFGVLDIEYKTGQPFGMSTFTFGDFIGLSPFVVQFTRRLSTWKYFVVLKSGNTLISDTSVTIVDESNDSGNSNNPYDDFSFSKTTSTVNGQDAFVFTSIAPSLTIPFFETAKLKLRLKKDISSVLTPIIDNLPNPTIGSISADPANVNITHIYVYI